MNKEIDSLIQEMVNFGHIVAHADDPANSDFHNACQLFSGHVLGRLAEIKSSLILTDCENDEKWTESEISNLSNLIALPDSSSTPYIQWSHNLSQYCEELQSNKLAIAL